MSSEAKASSIKATSADEIVKAAVEELDLSQRALDAKLKDNTNALDTTFKQLDDTVNLHKAQLKKLKQVQKMLAEQHAAFDENEFSQLEEQLESIEARLNLLRATKPRTGSLFVRLCLGKVNTKVWKKSEIVQLKTEYNKFKHRTTWLYLALSLISLFVQTRTIYVFCQLYMVYYYATLAIRENILQVNGSAIKDWWIFHHYLSLSVSLLFLVWPATPTFLLLSKLLCYVMFFQGVVMLVQNRYQDQRHYVRISLGKAKDVDPSSTETIVEKPVDLQILIPLLFLLYAAEFLLSFYMFSKIVDAEVQKTDTVYLFLSGILVSCIAAGNLFTTVTTLYEKTQKRKSLRRSMQKNK